MQFYRPTRGATSFAQRPLPHPRSTPCALSGRTCQGNGNIGLEKRAVFLFRQFGLIEAYPLVTKSFHSFLVNVCFAIHFHAHRPIDAIGLSGPVRWYPQLVFQLYFELVLYQFEPALQLGATSHIVKKSLYCKIK